MEKLIALDSSFFLFLNHLPHNTLFDAIGKLFSGIGTAGAVWFLLGIYFILRQEKKDHWFLAPLIIAGTLSWIITEGILKPMVARLRPAVEMGAIVIGSANEGFSFPSGHATIAWAMAVVLSHKEPKWKWVFYILALLISFSRIYLGKHYPFDVTGGGLIGWGIGALSIKISPRLKKILQKSF